MSSFEQATERILNYLEMIPDDCDVPLRRYDLKPIQGKVDIVTIANNKLFAIMKMFAYPNSILD
jgi:hypothetical protein